MATEYGGYPNDHYRGILSDTVNGRAYLFVQPPVGELDRILATEDIQPFPHHENWPHDNGTMFTLGPNHGDHNELAEKIVDKLNDVHGGNQSPRTFENVDALARLVFNHYQPPTA